MLRLASVLEHMHYSYELQNCTDDFMPVDYLTCHFCRNLTPFVFILVTLLICTLLLLFPSLLDQGTVRHVRLDNNILFIIS